MFLPGGQKDVWEEGRVGSEAPGVYFGHHPLFVFPRPGQYDPELGATSEDTGLGLGVSPGKGGGPAACCDLQAGC